LTTEVTDINKILLEQVSAGNERAFRKLVQQYADILHNYIHQLTKSHEMAEEVVQDIFLQIWTCRELLGNVRNFRNYLFVISRNHALNALKKALREKKRLREWETGNGPLLHAEQTDMEPQLSLIEEAIRQLPPQQQKVWVMSRREGMKYNEIAEKMGLSRETVKKYLQHATVSITQHVTSRMDLLLLSLLLIIKK
jgi:RNA polymerase sigma-70 factor (ECF subfamily)